MMDGYSHDYAQDALAAVERQAWKQCRRELLILGLGMFLYMLSTQVAAFLLVLLVNRLYPLWYLSTWITLGISSASIYGVGTGVLYLVVRRVRTNDIPGREPLRMNPVYMLVFFCVGYAGAFLANMITLRLASLLSSATGSDVANPLTTTMETASSLGALAVYMLLLAPVMEELVFRRILLVRLRKYGDVFAITVSAAAFGLFHTNLHQMLYAFVIGLVFAYVALRTGHVLYTVLLHMLINALGLGAHVMDLYAGTGTLLLYSMFIMGVIIAGITLFFVMKRQITLLTGKLPVGAGRKCLALLANPGCILFFAYVAYATIRSNFG